MCYSLDNTLCPFYVIIKMFYTLIFCCNPVCFPASRLHPKYVLTIHSAKALLAEQLPAWDFLLADSIIMLALAKGSRHEVCACSHDARY